MKKKSFNTFFCVLLFMLQLLPFWVRSQEAELLIRPSLTSLRGNDAVEENLDPAFNIGFGAGLNFLLGERGLINVGVFYEKKGGRKEFDLEIRDQNNVPIGDADAKLASNFHYILIPVQYGFRFGERIQFEAGLGMYGGILLKQEEKSEVGSYKTENEDTDGYKSLDFGASFSFSALLPLHESIRLKIGVSDYLGLVNVSDRNIIDNGSIKHNSIGVMLGLNFKLR